MSTKNLGFGVALECLKMGRRVSREGWNGNGQWLRLVKKENCAVLMPPFDGDGPDETRLLPWVGIYTVDGGFVPWTPTQTDMLAGDWEVVG